MGTTNRKGAIFKIGGQVYQSTKLEMNGYRSEQEEASSSVRQICCLVEDGERCKRQAGNASYSKRIQKTVSQRKLKLSLDVNARHIYICEHHKNMIQSVRSKRKRKDSDDETEMTEVDFCQLQVNTLRRYKRHYKLQTRPGLNKSQLVEALVVRSKPKVQMNESIQKHFKMIPCPEKETLAYFIYMIKTHKSKLDQKPDSN
ncbi:LOW QUALITY PROTEIN: histone deacetylase complex subunit SAP30 homolog [Acropora muricata]|uniref:LOW QUALITY PROTEIN: histone deacetylase complex subunit SAP30 homolog n=1 Tax=Acropora muricata TaxID=159855 RepID=UPI0034E5EFA0